MLLCPMPHCASPAFNLCSFPGSGGEQQRAKRRRVEGGASEDEEEQDEQEECTGALLGQLLVSLLVQQHALPLPPQAYASELLRTTDLSSSPSLDSPTLSPLPADAAWVRYSAVCGLLRLARAYDSHMPAALYANLALTLQVGGDSSHVVACLVELHVELGG